MADFDGPDATYGVTETILSNLRRATREYADTEIVALGEKITAREGSVVARTQGEELGAAIVLWGWYRVPEDTALVTVHFEVLKDISRLTLQTDEQSARVAVAEFESFQTQTRVSSEMGYLTLLTLGLARFEVGDLEEAVERLSAAMVQARMPREMVNPSIAYFYRGTAYIHMDQYDRAMVDFDRVLQLDSNFALAYMNRGSAFLEMGEYRRAIVDFNRALELDPYDAIAYYNRGMIYRKLGDEDAADADAAMFKKLTSQGQ